ncbi:MAG: RNA polymerase sigma factor [Putridiphycobacter sp.]
MTEEDLIKKCASGNALAQKKFYEKFAGKMMGVCLRYAKSTEEAEDVLQDAFIKIFNKIPVYEKKGSLEGWVRRIVVNTALDSYRKNKKNQKNVEAESVDYLLESKSYIVESLNAEDLLVIVNNLPEGYKIVFNLFAIEGYSHKEIAERLGITESTSKSQYSRAKKALRDVLINNKMVEKGER